MCQVCFYTRQSERGNAENKNNTAKQTKKNEKKSKKDPKTWFQGGLVLFTHFRATFLLLTCAEVKKFLRYMVKKKFPKSYWYQRNAHS